jgi:hypothetical protein
VHLAIGLAGVLILGGCASTPPPTASLVAARTAIGDAEKAGAGRFAQPELSEARDKLTAANSEVGKSNMIDAEQLANEARVEADLAAAKTEQAKAIAVNDEMKQSNAALIDEMQRKSSGVQQ